MISLYYIVTEVPVLKRKILSDSRKGSLSYNMKGKSKFAAFTKRYDSA